MKSFYFFLFNLLVYIASMGILNAQELPSIQPIIGQIGELENQKDPKCHATASRLEDFLFGTPLSFEARNKRIEFQKNYVKTIWLDFTKSYNNRSEKDNEFNLFKAI